MAGKIPNKNSRNRYSKSSRDESLWDLMWDKFDNIITDGISGGVNQAFDRAGNVKREIVERAAEAIKTKYEEFEAYLIEEEEKFLWDQGICLKKGIQVLRATAQMLNDDSYVFLDFAEGRVSSMAVPVDDYSITNEVLDLPYIPVIPIEVAVVVEYMDDTQLVEEFNNERYIVKKICVVPFDQFDTFKFLEFQVV